MYNQIAANKRKSWLLVILFFAVIIGIGYVWGLYNSDTTGTMVFALVIATTMALVSYYQGDAIALKLARAYPVEKKEDNPYVWRLVENLCITKGIAMPKVYLMPDTAINAFACGRDPEHASIAITEGSLAKLQNEELEGVIAHELSHITNYDIRLGTLVVILVGTVTILSHILLRSSMYGGRSRNREGNTGNVLMVVGLVLILLAPLIANLIKLAISRRREYLADASGALLTRYPEGLARALEKIEQDGQPMQQVAESTAHLYFSSPWGAAPKFMAKLFSTHPPIQDRVKALRDMISQNS